MTEIIANRPADVLSVVTGTAWRYFRKNFRGGYIDKWTSSPWSVSKAGGQLGFMPSGIYRVERYEEGKYVLIGEAVSLDEAAALVRGRHDSES